MTSKREWMQRARAAQESLDVAHQHRLELQGEVQRMTQEIERLADENEEHRHMAKRWRLVREIMVPSNGVSVITWDPRDFSEEENEELTVLAQNAHEHHKKVLLRRSLREFDEFARGVEETQEFEDEDDMEH